ncbi:MAG: hypothetical protein NTX32_07500 [Candidatus Firestonebacteria bacterium]|nr:hypothetical protein [Candidatus Firestonebacteria bacterium]
MRKILILLCTAAIAAGYGEGKTPVSDMDLQLMEELGVFKDAEKWEAIEQAHKKYGEKQKEKNKGNAKKLVEAQMFARLNAELELTLDQAAKIAENYYKSEKDREEYAKKKMAALTELNLAVNSEKSEESVLNSLIENCNRIDREQMEKVKETTERNSAVLSVKQRAKLILLEGRKQKAFNPVLLNKKKDVKQGEKKEEKKPESK